ncbi:hypothetical protein AAVH_22302 [Aphelenchoides avenae]|nr:hypothetical protein AAVH_22302 [Aphelenchus avenae]
MPRGDELLLEHLDAKATEDDVILRLNEFFEGFFAVENSVTLEQWNAALPTQQEKVEMTQLINLLYTLDTFDAIDPLEIMQGFPTLSRSVVLTILDEGRYCVIHEPVPCSARVGRLQCRLFPRFFGYAVIQARRHAERLVHHSAAHFQSDGNVCNQSAAIFERTASRSIVVAGASRYAVMGHNPSPCQPQFQVADAAHNNATMFHVMNVAMHRAAKKYAKKRSAPFEDVFIQWHGMAETSCQSAPIFISAGAPGTNPVYQNRSSPVQKMLCDRWELSSRLVLGR